MSYKSKEDYERALRKSRAVVKSHARKGTKGVKKHTRKITKRITQTVPSRVDDKAVEEVIELYDQMEEYIANVGLSGDPDEKEMLHELIKDTGKDIAKYPKEVRRKALKMREI